MLVQRVAKSIIIAKQENVYMTMINKNIVVNAEKNVKIMLKNLQKYCTMLNRIK